MCLAMDDLSKPSRGVPGSAVIERGHGVGDGAERVSQLVGQRGEELFLGPIGLGRLAIELGVFEEDAGEVADALEQADFPLRERPPRRPPDHEEAAHRPVLDPDRHEQIGLMREVSEGLGIDARVPRHVVGPHGAPMSPRLLDGRVVLDGNRKPAEGIEHVGRDVISGHGPQTLARRVGEVGPDHVSAERPGDLARHSPHRLGGVESRAQRPAHREQGLCFAQAEPLALPQVGPRRLGPPAVGDVAQDGQVVTSHESRRRAVFDVPDLTVGADHPQLSGLLAGLEKALPGRFEIHSRLQEIVESPAEQIPGGPAKQPAGGRIGVDEHSRVVDDDHGITGAGGERLGLLLAGHQQ
jgi:hypothetical protein